MPQTPHTETHFTGDALFTRHRYWHGRRTNRSFALVAGLSAAVSSTHVVIIAGLAEIAAGSIAMGLGGFLAARSNAERYEQELLREKREVETIPDAEAKEGADIFPSYGLTQQECRYTGAPSLRGALQTLFIGALAVGAAYLIARWLSLASISFYFFALI